MSRRINEVLAEFSPHVEVYSVDESFVGFQGFEPGTLEERGQQIRQTVRQWTGIPVSVGFAPTRVLAKVANHAAKKNDVFRGVCLLEADSPVTIALLKQLPVTELWVLPAEQAKGYRSWG
ncbi:hypothetical protein HAALTHF_05170n [Vreelandella aquamarina]|nr:hypothetical protein HAALTHF_05170n [Halomonas axialensis]